MTAAAPTLAAAPAARTPTSFAAVTLAGWGVIALAVAARIFAGLGTPLWFDETFSAVIASQPSAAAMVDWCRAEIGGPVYYMTLWGWAQLFGTSAVALRSLSLVASVAAPALVVWRGHPDRTTRLVWAALLALWLPAIDHATNARCYALATFLTTVQAIAFWRLMQAPTLRRALAWTGVSVLAILSHSHCAALAVAGGLLFVAVHRRRALACWPALLLLLPMAAWLSWQYPVLKRFSIQGAWYQPFGLGDLLLAPIDLFDSLLLGIVLAIGPILTFAGGWRVRRETADRALAASGLIALAIALALTVVKPSFVWRYAVPYGPAILFAVASWACGIRARFPRAPALLVALFAASTFGYLAELIRHPDERYRLHFTLDRPSAWLAGRGAHHLAFLWDGPTGASGDPRRFDEVAGYFLRQGGRGERVTVLRAPGAAEPSQLVAAALARDPSIDSMIWIADRMVPGTHGAPDRRLMARLGWACRDYARDPMAMVTCHAPDR